MSRYVNPDRGAPDCDDQLPMISRVGRGIRGDSYRVEIDDPDSNRETHLHGYVVDGPTGEVTSDWVSENVNGGELLYQYNLRPFTVPQTFTITFLYRRPGRPEWTWTTPAIPYIWSIDENGNKDQGDGIVGSGVATVFIRKVGETTWKEKLIYPKGTTREDFNAPEAESAWTVNLEVGVGGDIDVPTLDDIAKILGISVDQIKQILKGGSVIINGVSASNLIQYIDKQDDNHLNTALTHLHKDLGFSSGFLPGDGGATSVKKYIDDLIAGINKKINGLPTDSDLDQIRDDITKLKSYVKNALTDIVNKVYLGGTIGEDGNITWPTNDKIAIGNINVYSGGTSNFIRTDADGENDLQFK